MADIKLENLPVRTAIAASDKIPFTSDPSGTPLSANITRDNLFQYLVTKSLYDAYSILMATADDTPVPITITEQTVVGRLTGEAIKSLSVTELTALINAGTVDLKGALELATNAEALTGTDTARALTADDLVYVLTQRNVNRWTTVPSANFTAAPASTSTLTMGVDMTASIKAGMTLEYTISSVVYYGQVSAIASNLLTVRGAPLSGSVTLLRYGGGVQRQLCYDATVNVDGTANTTTLKTGTVYTLTWRGPVSYLVFYDAYQTTHDSHATHGKVTVKVAGSDVNSSAGGLEIAANATTYKTVVDIATANYDINENEDLTIVVTQGGTPNGAGLRVNIVIVTP